MTEILTESFCERCGTRYTFESSAPRKSRLGRVRMLSKGVRNFVMSDESSFSEAMAEARSEEELAATAHQLDAFHRTFNFCLTCRQYTCGDCWNTAEGRCLTCAPIPGQEEPAARLDLAAMAPVVLDAGVNGNGHDHGEAPDAEAWPETDLPADRLARVLDLPVAEPVEVEADGVEVEGLSAAAQAEAPADEAVAEVGTGAGAATPTGEPAAETPGAAPDAHPQVLGVAPGQTLDDAIAAYEASLAAGAAEVAAVPVPDVVAAVAAPAIVAAVAAPDIVAAVAAPEAESVEAAPEPEPVAAEPEAIAEPVAEPVAEPEPVAATVEAEPAETVAPEPEVEAAEPEAVTAEAEPVAEAVEAEPSAPERAAASQDRIAQPTWPAAPAPAAPAASAPEAAPAATPAPNPWLTVAPDDASQPQWPVAPAWRTATPRREVPLTLAGRPLLPQADASALWAASAQEVLGAAPAPLAAAAPAAAQPCVSCGLSLSANARFCRRCGSRQG